MAEFLRQPLNNFLFFGADDDVDSIGGLSIAWDWDDLSTVVADTLDFVAGGDDAADGNLLNPHRNKRHGAVMIDLQRHLFGVCSAVVTAGFRNGGAANDGDAANNVRSS